MTRTIAIAASFFLALGTAEIKATAASATAPSAIVRIGIGLLGGRLKVYKQPRKGWILPCMDRWAPSGCCTEGGSIYRGVQNFLDYCCAWAPNLDEWCNCSPDCCRSATASGFDGLRQSSQGGFGLNSLVGFGGGFGNSVLSQPVESNRDEEQELAFQKNIVSFLDISALAQVASFDNWSIYLGGSVSGNPLSYGSEYTPFKDILSKRRENKPLYQNNMYVLFGPEFRYSFNNDFSVFGGVQVGLARVSNFIPQSENAGKILATKSAQLTGALDLFLGAVYSINDDMEAYVKVGRKFVSNIGTRAFEGSSSKNINVEPCGSMHVSAGISFLM